MIEGFLSLHCLCWKCQMAHSEIEIKSRLSGVSKVVTAGGISQQLLDMVKIRLNMGSCPEGVSATVH
jgi:hypothetical protein